MKTVKSPLRYPGGKSKAVGRISEYMPARIEYYREPFVGGGSVFLDVLQRNPGSHIWINDINDDVYSFWQSVKTQCMDLVEMVKAAKNNFSDGRELYQSLKEIDTSSLSFLEKGARFFILNRITFSGTLESGGYSQSAYEKRFTDSCIDRLSKLSTLDMSNVNITCMDYESSILNYDADEKTFIYLDPPYMGNHKSRLYGKKGDLHSDFNHYRLAELLDGCIHDWLMTYDDVDEVKKLYAHHKIYPWDYQYSMNNFKQSNCAMGKELMIANR